MGVSIPLASFSHIPHAAAPAIREAVWSPMLRPPSRAPSVTELQGRVNDRWRLWHGSVTHMIAAQDADRPLPLAGAAWTLAMVQRSRGDNDGALELVREGADLLRPELENGTSELRAMYGALLLNAALTCARAGREGDALHYLDEGNAVAERLPQGYLPTGPRWLSLPGAPESVGGARRFAIEVLGEVVQHDPDHVDDVVLVVSELVTNAIREVGHDAVRLYEQGWTIRQVAARFEYGYGTMRRVLKNHTTLRARGGPRAGLTHR